MVIVTVFGVVMIALGTAAHEPYSFIDAGIGIPAVLYGILKLRTKKRPKDSFYVE